MLIGAIDIGGSKSIAGVVDETGKVLATRNIATEKTGCAANLVRCAAALRVAVEEYGLSVNELAGVGVSLPGTVDCTQTHLLLAPGAGWKDFPAADFLRRELGLQALWCENDGNNCARAELRFGGAPAHFIWLTVSTGIGGAVVAENRVVLGASSLAGELGHYRVETEQPLPCPCGSSGCLEAHASGSAISRQFSALAARDEGAAAMLRKLDMSADAAGCAALARAGFAPAGELFRRAGEYLGQALAPVVSILNPECVYIGGGVSRSLDLLLPGLRGAVQARAAAACANVEICATRLGYEASLLGAAALFLEKYGQ